MLMIVLCDREGRIYDVWISFGSMLEVRAFRERKKRGVWFRELVEICVVYGDRGYRGCEGVMQLFLSTSGPTGKRMALKPKAFN